jgi:universal stress protein A
MTGFQKIMVPVDFSEHSQRALDYAVGLANRFGAEVVVFHCYQLPIPPFGHPPYTTVLPDSYVGAVREAAIQATRRWADTARTQGVRVREEISAGFPANEIATLAKDVGADLIVMGTRGLSGLEHVLLGSVTERTIRIAPCPVLTINNELRV